LFDCGVTDLANTAAPLQVNIAGETARVDAWWIPSVLVWLVLGSFGLYTFWATTGEQANFAEIGPYISPFFSPNLKDYVPDWFEKFQWLSPAYLVIWAPLLFRGTCYYGRKIYYRAVFTPPACAVGPNQSISQLYEGERPFPFVLMNLHRFFFYIAVVLVVFHWYHFSQALQFANGTGIGVGSLVILVDALFLTLYVFSCHSWRHLLAGKLNCFSCSNFTDARYKAWVRQSWLNERHGLYFWLSLISVWFADVYIRQVAMGNWTDVVYIFGQGFTTL